MGRAGRRGRTGATACATDTTVAIGATEGIRGSVTAGGGITGRAGRETMGAVTSSGGMERGGREMAGRETGGRRGRTVASAGATSTAAEAATETPGRGRMTGVGSTTMGATEITGIRGSVVGSSMRGSVGRIG